MTKQSVKAKGNKCTEKHPAKEPRFNMLNKFGYVLIVLIIAFAIQFFFQNFFGKIVNQEMENSISQIKDFEIKGNFTGNKSNVVNTFVDNYDNYVGVSSDSFITIILLKVMFLNLIKLWFYDKDKRIHFIEIEYSIDGITFKDLFGHREKMPNRVHEVPINFNALVLRIRGWDTSHTFRKKQVHLTHFKLYGGVARTTSMADDTCLMELEFSKIHGIKKFKIDAINKDYGDHDWIINGPPSKERIIGCMKGTSKPWIVVNFNEFFYIDKMYLYFYGYDKRKHYVQVELSHDGVTFKPFFGNFKEVSDVLEISPKKNLKAFRIHGYDDTYHGKDAGHVHMTFMKILGIEQPICGKN